MKSNPNNDQPNLNTPNQPSKVNPQSMNECFLSTKQASSGSNKQIVLPPELEPLRMVIMSQHCALAPHIQELGNISLKFTTIIEQKKESSNKIFHDNFIPRSLRIKCDLTTTSAYENNPEFLSLKQELQETVRTFTKQGLLVMQKWSLINIKLLTNDRCHNILKKALSILGGLLLYCTDILEPKSWPSHFNNQILLLLIKIFFTTDYSTEIDSLLEYLEIQNSEILLIASKIINQGHDNDNEYHQTIIDSLDMNHITNLDQTLITLINETLTPFEQILQAATCHLWDFNRQNIRQMEATQKLKAKLDNDRVKSATAATTHAITKAISHINEDNKSSQINQLRIQNLEKQALQQKQISQEILNILKQPKNLKRGQPGSLTSLKSTSNPFTPITDDVVDLTISQSQSPNQSPHQYTPPPPLKKQRRIQWDTDTHINFNPLSTPIQMFGSSQTLSGIQPTNMAHPPYNLNQFTPTQHLHNPFISIKPTTTSTHRRNHGAKVRGGRRGSQRRP